MGLIKFLGLIPSLGLISLFGDVTPMTLSDLFTALSTFLGGFFGSIGEIINGINGSAVLMAFAFLIPLTSVGVSYLFRFMGRRSRRRR